MLIHVCHIFDLNRNKSLCKLIFSCTFYFFVLKNKRKVKVPNQYKILKHCIMTCHQKASCTTYTTTIKMPNQYIIREESVEKLSECLTSKTYTATATWLDSEKTVRVSNKYNIQPYCNITCQWKDCKSV